MGRHRSLILVSTMGTATRSGRPTLLMSIFGRLFPTLLLRVSVRWFVMLKSLPGLMVLNDHRRFVVLDRRRRFKVSHRGLGRLVDAGWRGREGGRWLGRQGRRCGSNWYGPWF